MDGMPHYDERPVPRGPSGRWEVVLADEERDGTERARLSALEIRSDHRILQHFEDAELARIPLLAGGEPLVRFKQYLDLQDPARAAFVAEGVESVRPGQRIVAKAEVDPELWDRLVEASHEVVGWRRRRSA